MMVVVTLVCVAVMCDGGRQYSPCSSPCRRTCSNAALPVYLSTCDDDDDDDEDDGGGDAGVCSGDV